MPHPRPNRIDPIHSRIRTQTPHPLLCSPPNSRDASGRRVLRRRVVADRTLSQKDVSLLFLRACKLTAPSPPGAVVLTTPLLAQRDRRRPLRSKLGFVRQTLGMRGNPSLGDECGDDDGAETQGDDDDGDGNDAGIDLRLISHIFWNQSVHFRSLCVTSTLKRNFVL